MPSIVSLLVLPLLHHRFSIHTTCCCSSRLPFFSYSPFIFFLFCFCCFSCLTFLSAAANRLNCPRQNNQMQMANHQNCETKMQIYFVSFADPVASKAATPPSPLCCAFLATAAHSLPMTISMLIGDSDFLAATLMQKCGQNFIIVRQSPNDVALAGGTVR